MTRISDRHQQDLLTGFSWNMHPPANRAASDGLALPESIGRNTTFKLFLLCLLSLLLLIPLTMVQSLVSERRHLKQEAERTVADGLAYQPRVLTPYLVVAITESNDQWQEARTSDWALLPSDAKVDGTMRVSPRQIGIYEVPTFTSDFLISVNWDSEAFARLEAPNRRIDWSSARIEFALSAPRGLRSPAPMQLKHADASGQTITRKLELEPIGLAFQNYHSIGSKLDWTAPPQGGLQLTTQFQHVGTHALEVVPLARRTTLEWTGDWPHPSYVAGLLPEQHSSDEAGFKAQWQLSEFNLGLPRLIALAPQLDLSAQTISMRIYQPADVYQRSERSVKYGALIIGLAMLSFFLAEVLLRVRLHPVHYGLIGMTLAVFYLLLLALSELIGFASAFLAAALASCLLLGFYASAILHGLRRGLVSAGMLGLVYGYSFVLVTAESLNLLMGAVGLMVLLALTMVLTRKIDWYARLPGPV